jgi:hypothetical protein
MSLKFPLATSQLWDRSPCGSAIVVKYSDIFSFFILISKDIHQFLSSISYSSDQSELFSASIVHVSELPDVHRRTLEHSIYKTTCKFAFFLNDSDLSYNKISIPLNRLDITDSFSISEETEKFVPFCFGKCIPLSHFCDRSLCENLFKSIKFSRELAIKHFIRINAYGKSSKLDRLKELNSRKGSLKLDALLPDFSIRCQLVQSISVFSTPLSELLLKPLSAGSSPNRPIFGYASLNQVRKLVLVTETDPAVSTVQLVGVWIRFELPVFSSEMDLNGIIRHPLCWAACLRFLQKESINRCILDNNTFLLVIFSRFFAGFFQLYFLVGSDGKHQRRCWFTVLRNNSSDRREDRNMFTNKY